VKNIKLEQILIRPIEPEDNAQLAVVVRNTLTEFGANHPGTVYYDPTTDALYELFRQPRSAYFVAEYKGQILGGGGIFPTAGLPNDTCELVKMYLVPEARGIGLGKSLIEKCFEKAKEFGFCRVYLETMPELKQALTVYEKFGFRYLDGPMGNSGHFGCERWMIKNLED
jgi:putative acetyltransferase